MRSFDQFIERLKQYQGAKYIYEKDKGLLAWQVSTGENVEILFIEVKEKRKGIGKELLKKMCRMIDPYHSVFVVRRKINEEAGGFYRAMGFKEVEINGLYKDEVAVIGTVRYKDLIKKCFQ